jgi:hypothetical protein
MNIENKLRAQTVMLKDLSYKYMVGDSAVYIYKVNVCMNPSNRTKKDRYDSKHSIELRFLNRKGEETIRKCAVYTYDNFVKAIDKKFFVPLNDASKVKILPQLIKVSSLYYDDDSEKILFKNRDDASVFYYGKYKRINLSLANSKVWTEGPFEMRLSSFGWSVYNADKRYVTKVDFDLIEIDEFKLAEILL